MYPRVVTKDPTAVEVQVQAAYLAMFPRGNQRFVPRVFAWATDSFTGRHPDFQQVDARYHDLEHTLQGTLCLARLLHGRHQAGARPRLTQKALELALLAILLHDTGYLKRKGDLNGTGAKYTAIHVTRSLEFSAELLKGHRFPVSDIQSVQNMIRCTASSGALSRIPFRTELEKILGGAVGTADLLGQMSAEDYVDKLPALYLEFAEAARHPWGKAPLLDTFSTPDDLIQQTPEFWENQVQRRLERDFGGVYRFLNQPYPSGRNDYLERIEENMERVRQRLEGQRTSKPTMAGRN
jgi:hypothetical protein